MIPKEIIELAIEGGWKPAEIYQEYHHGYGNWIKSIVLDPLFWQALGRALGWIDAEPFVRISCQYDGCFDDTEDTISFNEKNPEIWKEIKDGEPWKDDGKLYELCRPMPEWKKKSAQFFSLLMSSSDPAPFWQELMDSKK